MSGRLRSVSQPARRSIGARAVSAAARLGRRAFAFCGVLGLLFLVLSLNVAAQVVADTTHANSATAELTATSNTLTFNHSTNTAGTLNNQFLLVGVSMNVEQNTSAAVSGVTYNGTNLYFVGAHIDTGNNMRVEMWAMVAPPSGTNLPVVVTANATGGTVGLWWAQRTFSGVNQSHTVNARPSLR